MARRVNTEKYISTLKIINYNLCIRQCHRRYYKLSYQGSIVPPMALAEAQVVIYLFFSIKYKYIDQSLVCVAYSIHMIHANILLNQDFFNWDISHHGVIRSNGSIRNDPNVRVTILNKGSISVVLISEKYTGKGLL